MRSDFLTTAAAAEKVGVAAVTIWRACRRYPGFGVRVGGAYRIPAAHIEMLLQGLTPAEISAQVRARGAARAA